MLFEATAAIVRALAPIVASLALIGFAQDDEGGAAFHPFVPEPIGHIEPKGSTELCGHVRIAELPKSAETTDRCSWSFEVEGDGKYALWLEAAGDSSFEVVRMRNGEEVRRTTPKPDGNGVTCWYGSVSLGLTVVVEVQLAGSSGSGTLQRRWSVETPATVASARDVEELVAEVDQLESSEAGEQLALVLDRCLSAEGSATSDLAEGALASICNAAASLGRMDLARTALENVVALAHRARPTDSEYVVDNLALLGDWTVDDRRAADLLALVVERRERTLGESHRDFISALGRYGARECDAGDFDRGLEALRRGHRLAEALLDPDDSVRRFVDGRLAYQLRRPGSYEESEHLYRQILERTEASGTPPASTMVASLTNHALVLDHLGRYDEVYAQLERALLEFGPDVDPTSRNLDIALDTFFASCIAIGRWPDAERLHALYEERFEEIATSDPRPLERLRGSWAYALGELHWSEQGELPFTPFSPRPLGHIDSGGSTENCGEIRIANLPSVDGDPGLRLWPFKFDEKGELKVWLEGAGASTVEIVVVTDDDREEWGRAAADENGVATSRGTVWRNERVLVTIVVRGAARDATVQRRWMVEPEWTLELQRDVARLVDEIERLDPAEAARQLVDLIDRCRTSKRSATSARVESAHIDLCNAALSIDRRDLAIVAMENVVACAARSNAPDSAYVTENLELLAMWTKHPSRAVALYAIVAERLERSLGPAHPRAIRAIRRLGVALHGSGASEVGMATLRRAHELAAASLSIGDTERDATVESLANALYSDGHYDEAEPLYRAIVARVETAPDRDPTSTLVALTNLAMLLRRTVREEEAFQLLHRAVGEYGRRLDPGNKNLHTALSQFFESCAALDRWSHAEDEYAAYSDDFESLADQGSGNRDELLSSWAAGLAAAGQSERSIQTYEELVTRLEDDPTTPWDRLADERNRLAILLANSGSPRRAIPVFEALAATHDERQGPASRDAISVRLNLAAAYSMAGETELMQRVEAELVELLEASADPNPKLLDRLRISVASSLVNRGDVEEGVELFLSLATPESRLAGRGLADEMMLHSNLAAGLDQLGRYEEAETHHLQALELYRRQSTSTPASSLPVVSSYANFLRNRRRPDEAIELLESADARLSSSYQAGSAKIVSLRASLLGIQVDQGHAEDALATARRLLDAVSANLASTTLTGGASGQRDRSRMEQPIAILAFTLLHFSKEYTTESDVERYFEMLAFRRAIASVSLSTVRGVGNDGEWESVQEELRRVARRLSNTVLTLDEATETLDSDRRIAELARERDRLEARLREMALDASIHLDPVPIETIAESLDDRTALVVFSESHWGTGISWGSKTLFASVITRDGDHGLMFAVGQSDELEEYISAWRGSIGRGIDRGLELVEGPTDDESSERLSRAVLARVLERVPEGVERLLVVADGPLHLVPLDALPLGDGLVGERFEVELRPAPYRIVPLERTARVEQTLFAVGNVDYRSEPSAAAATDGAEDLEPSAERGLERRFRPLIQTQFEVEAVGLLFESAGKGAVSIVRGPDATRERVLADLPNATHIHLATHGWFHEALGATDVVEQLAPMALCGLAFAGSNREVDDAGNVPGIVTGEELARLDLSSCELCVLSACETNVGLRRSGDGISSLQAAVHAAGARTAITSLWRVDDAATRRLMELFYTGLWVDGLDVSDALWNAKMMLRAEGHPVRDWAGWVLTGGPD